MEYNIPQRAIESTLETGATFVNAQLERVNYSKLRKYFDVDDTYLKNKIKLILFPFYHEETQADYGTRPDKLYRPDMYIPIMSLISMLLLNAFILGLANKFHPEIVCLAFTRSLCFHAFLSLLYKLAAYITGLHFSYTDIIAISGYKFFIAIPIKISKSFYLGYALVVYFLISFLFFLSRSLKGVLLGKNDSKNCIYLLFAVVIVELLILVFWVSK